MTTDDTTHQGPPAPSVLITLALLISEGQGEQASALLTATGLEQRAHSVILGMAHLTRSLGTYFADGPMVWGAPTADPVDGTVHGQYLTAAVIDAVLTDGPSAGMRTLMEHAPRDQQALSEWYGHALAAASGLLLRAYTGDLRRTFATDASPDDLSGLAGVAAPDSPEGIDPTA